MSAMDKSTRKLKRLYVWHIRKVWHYQPHRMDGFHRDIGLSRYFWDHRRSAEHIRKELVRRGVEMP